MKIKSRKILKIVSLFLANLFIMDQISFAAVDFKPSEFLLFAQALPSLEIPRSVAITEEAYRANNSKTILFIQDAHTNESGQINLSKALDQILSKEKIKYVFLEGGTGNDSLSFLRDQAPLEHRKKVAMSYLKQGVVSGDEYLDLTSDRSFVLWGVENKELYWKAVKAYQAVAQSREKYQDYLKRIGVTIESLKTKIFNPDLLSFDRKNLSYLKEEKSFTDYFEVLAKEAAKRNIPLQYYPHLETLKAVKEKEKGIDFKKANDEQVKAAASLLKEDLEALSGAEAAIEQSPFKVSSQDHKEKRAFYALLEEKLAKTESQKSKAEYTELFKYFDYLKEAQKIDAKNVLEEQEQLENQLYASLIRNKDEEALYRASKNLRCLTGLLNLQLTPDKFEEYRRNRSDFGLVQMTGFLNRKIMDLQSQYERAIFLEEGYEDTAKKAEEFYLLTYERDKAFVRNMIRKMDEEKQDTAVFISGGYHAVNMKELFKKENISYLSLIPQIFQETNHKRYEKLLLEQLSSENQSSSSARKTVSSQAADTARLASLIERPIFGTVMRDIVSSRRLAPARPALNVNGARLAGWSATAKKAFYAALSTVAVLVTQSLHGQALNLKFLTNNANITTGLTTEYVGADAAYWNSIGSASNDVNQVVHRVISKYSVPIYANALAQINYSIAGLTNRADQTTTMLSNGSLGQFPDIRAHSPFTYGNAQVTLPTTNSYTYRLLSGGGVYSPLTDPLTGATNFVGYPENNTIHWIDYKADTGANVWANILGPLQTAYKKYNGVINLSSNEAKLAFNILPALEAMKVPSGPASGAIYLAPNGTSGIPGNIISNENQASVLAALDAMLFVLNQNQSNPQYANLVARVNNLRDGVITYLSARVYNPSLRIFNQGGSVNTANGAFTVDSNVASDATVWNLTVLLGSIKNIYAMDSWWGGFGSSYLMWQQGLKPLTGVYDTNGVLRGIDFINWHVSGKPNINAEQTAGAILMTRELAKAYRAAGREDYAADLETDAVTMSEGLDRLREVRRDGSVAYRAVDKEAPQSPNGPVHALPSVTATAWKIFTDYRFPDAGPYDFSGYHPFKINGRGAAATNNIQPNTLSPTVRPYYTLIPEFVKRDFTVNFSPSGYGYFRTDSQAGNQVNFTSISVSPTNLAFKGIITTPSNGQTYQESFSFGQAGTFVSVTQTNGTTTTRTFPTYNLNGLFLKQDTNGVDTLYFSLPKALEDQIRTNFPANAFPTNALIRPYGLQGARLTEDTIHIGKEEVEPLKENGARLAAEVVYDVDEIKKALQGWVSSAGMGLKGPTYTSLRVYKMVSFQLDHFQLDRNKLLSIITIDSDGDMKIIFSSRGTEALEIDYSQIYAKKKPYLQKIGVLNGNLALVVTRDFYEEDLLPRTLRNRYSGDTENERRELNQVFIPEDDSRLKELKVLWAQPQTVADEVANYLNELIRAKKHTEQEIMVTGYGQKIVEIKGLSLVSRTGTQYVLSNPEHLRELAARFDVDLRLLQSVIERSIKAGARLAEQEQKVSTRRDFLAKTGLLTASLLLGLKPNSEAQHHENDRNQRDFSIQAGNITLQREDHALTVERIINNYRAIFSIDLRQPGVIETTFLSAPADELKDTPTYLYVLGDIQSIAQEARVILTQQQSKKALKDLDTFDRLFSRVVDLDVDVTTIVQSIARSVELIAYQDHILTLRGSKLYPGGPQPSFYTLNTRSNTVYISSIGGFESRYTLENNRQEYLIALNFLAETANAALQAETDRNKIGQIREYLRLLEKEIRKSADQTVVDVSYDFNFLPNGVQDRTLITATVDLHEKAMPIAIEQKSFYESSGGQGPYTWTYRYNFMTRRVIVDKIERRAPYWPDLHFPTETYSANQPNYAVYLSFIHARLLDAANQPDTNPRERQAFIRYVRALEKALHSSGRRAVSVDRGVREDAAVEQGARLAEPKVEFTLAKEEIAALTRFVLEVYAQNKAPVNASKPLALEFKGLAEIFRIKVEGNQLKFVMIVPSGNGKAEERLVIPAIDNPESALTKLRNTKSAPQAAQEKVSTTGALTALRLAAMRAEMAFSGDFTGAMDISLSALAGIKDSSKLETQVMNLILQILERAHDKRYKNAVFYLSNAEQLGVPGAKEFVEEIVRKNTTDKGLAPFIRVGDSSGFDGIVFKMVTPAEYRDSKKKDNGRTVYYSLQPVSGDQFYGWNQLFPAGLSTAAVLAKYLKGADGRQAINFSQIEDGELIPLLNFLKQFEGTRNLTLNALRDILSGRASESILNRFSFVLPVIQKIEYDLYVRIVHDMMKAIGAAA